MGLAGSARGVVATLRADGMGAADIPALLLESFLGAWYPCTGSFLAVNVIVYSHDG